MNKILLSALLLSFCAVTGCKGAPSPVLQAPNNPPHVWACSEFPIDGIPDAANPFDPDSIAVDVTFTTPSGKTLTMPAFWYQPYTRRLIPGSGPIDPKTGKPGGTSVERLTPSGAPGWRVRWTPLEPGLHHCKIVVTRNGAQTEAPQASISVGPAAAGARGFVRVEPQSKRYFKTDDGQPLPLLGEDACWTHERGTYDYDDWFTQFQKNGMNNTRLWMYETFAIEFFPDERLHYNQAHAWDLDYVMDEGAQKGVYLMLCLDYHGMFQNRLPDNPTAFYWPHSAYNKANGGPCATPEDFFINPDAKALYKKRLRYLIARYSAEPSLMSWQLFNEINQVYKDAKPADVVAWHAEMSAYLHAHDPYDHLVTTSLGSATEEPEMWKIPTLDYTLYHWYCTWGGAYIQPAKMVADVTARYHRDFDKPFYLDEFGTSGLNNSLAEDPYRRGLSQALWAGIICGSAGTPMPWPWYTIDQDNLYPLWDSLHEFLAGTHFGSAAWHPGVVTSAPESYALGDPDPAGAPFDTTVALALNWGAQSPDPLVLRQAEDGDGDGGTLSGFIDGAVKSSKMPPLTLNVRTGSDAHLIVHVNSVSDDAILGVRVNGSEIFRRALPNTNAKWEFTNDYNQNIDVPLPAGALNIEIFNAGGDWVYLDSVKITGALPSLRPKGEPALDAWCMTNGKTALLWAIDPDFDYPRGARAPARTLAGAFVDLHDLPDGRYRVTWWNTEEGKAVGALTATSHAGLLRLPVAPFQTDIAARITPGGN